MSKVSKMANTRNINRFELDSDELASTRKQARKLAKLAKRAGQHIKRNDVNQNLDMYNEDVA